MNTGDVIATSHPLIADIGSAFYFKPETIAVGKENGLDGFRFYFLGRGGVLGDVEPSVVLSAFGYFNPGLVEKLWTTAKEKMAPRDAARLYQECNAELGRRTLDDVAGLGEFCDAAAAVNDAIDPTGLALYAGVSAEPVPDDIPAKAMHLAACLREARGSAHLAAIVAQGLDPQKAHCIKRPDDWEMFGYSDEQRPTVTDEDRQLHKEAETATDRMMTPAFSVLDDGGADALVAGAKAIHAALTAP